MKTFLLFIMIMGFLGLLCTVFPPLVILIIFGMPLFRKGF